MKFGDKVRIAVKEGVEQECQGKVGMITKVISEDPGFYFVGVEGESEELAFFENELELIDDDPSTVK